MKDPQIKTWHREREREWERIVKQRQEAQGDTESRLWSGFTHVGPGMLRASRILMIDGLCLCKLVSVYFATCV